jgi:hypothetical protein
MSILPASQSLPIEHLSASFDNVTNSYKFYWFLAILDHVRNKQTRVIPVRQLTTHMVANVWYPTNYFRLSFGKQDRLGQIAVNVGAESSLPVDSERNQVIRVVLDHLKDTTSLSHEIESLQEYVPYRFLRPFFASRLRGMKDTVINANIEKMAGEAYNDPQSPCLYRFVSAPEFSIEIHPLWFEYLRQHLAILTGFCMWNLVGYLQKNNPNVPNIPNKLIEPSQRDLKRAREFWNIVFGKLEKMPCIYSDQEMKKDGFSLDHFLPWRFVAHDLLWNIIPAPKNINSAKSDNLPDVEKYFDSFSKLQHQAVQVVSASERSSLLEDYILLTKSSSAKELSSISLPNFRGILYDTIAPQIQIAANMGFSAHWQCK